MQVDQINLWDIPAYLSVVKLLHCCGKDMAARYGLHHWDNPLWKTCAIVGLCALKNQIYLVFHEGMPVATFQIKITGRTLWFEKLATIPALEGNGIGSFCLTEIERISKEKGCSEIACDVYAKSTHAKEFYQRREYKTVEMAETLKYSVLRLKKNVEA